MDDGASTQTVTPRLISSTRSSFEGQATPVSTIVTEQLAWDAEGNVAKARERAYADAGATPTHELLTDFEFAHDQNSRFLQRVSRVVQRDGDGTLLSDLRTMYDGLPEGQVGRTGLVTERVALALTDEQASPSTARASRTSPRPATSGERVRSVGGESRAVRPPSAAPR